MPDEALRRVAAVPADPGPGGLSGWLADRSPAFASYRDALARHLGMDDAAVERLLRDLSARPGTRDADRLRHAFHVATRESLLDWTFGGKDAAEAHCRLLDVCAELPGSYQGPLAERWYRRFRRQYGDGVELEWHPSARPADNPALPSRCQPDHVHVAGREAGEVKSTAHGMGGPDIGQTGDLLNAIQEQGRLTLTRKGGGTVEVDRYRLTFTNPRGAADPKTAKQLLRWLEKYDFLTIEVIVEGQSRTFGKAKAGDLAALLARSGG